MVDVQGSLFNGGGLRVSPPLLFSAAFVAILASACGGSLPDTPTSSLPVHAPPKVDLPLDVAAVVDALDYWQSSVGITYVLVEDNVEPRLLIRPGTDGL